MATTDHIHPTTIGESVDELRHLRLLPIDELKLLPNDRGRPTDDEHVRHIAESILVDGLLNPPTVDCNGHVVAGRHRRLALLRVREHYPIEFAMLFPDALIAVRVLSFNAIEHPNSAIAAEAIENCIRNDYDDEQVRELARRLHAAGYSDKPGRPPKGTKALVPTLEMLTGRNASTIRRILGMKARGTEKPTNSVREREVDDDTKVKVDAESSSGEALVSQENLANGQVSTDEPVVDAAIGQVDGVANASGASSADEQLLSPAALKVLLAKCDGWRLSKAALQALTAIEAAVEVFLSETEGGAWNRWPDALHGLCSHLRDLPSKIEDSLKLAVIGRTKWPCRSRSSNKPAEREDQVAQATASEIGGGDAG